MPHGRNKYQSRENRARVREVLMQDWDPIGVRDAPEAQDEYDSYAGRVYVMLMDERASPELIAEYLYRVATEHMGLSPQSELAERSARTASILVGLRPQFELH
jgi:hypothetical protein